MEGSFLGFWDFLDGAAGWLDLGQDRGKDGGAGRCDDLDPRPTLDREGSQHG